jgi:hypothetical protein
MKRLSWLLILTVGTVLAFSGLAMAQEGGAAPADPSGEQVMYKKTTIIDFSDVTITGELTKPEGSYLMNKKKANFDLLIRVRDNFLPEMIKTVDNL